MARARNIKPGLFKNEILGDLGPFDRLLFIGLWTLADRDGRLEDRPKRIRIELFPFDDYDVDAGLSRLAEKGFIRRYQIKDYMVIQVIKFLCHQKPHATEKDSVLPCVNGLITVNKRTPNGCVTGDPQLINCYLTVDSTSNNAPYPLSLIPCTESLVLNPESLKPLVPGASAGLAESNGPDQPGFEQMVLDDTNTADFARAVSIEYARTWGLPSAPPVGMQLGSTVCMRARSHPPAMNLDWWPRYFERCLTDDFLNGTKNPKFIADFSYLITEKTFASVINASHLESSHG